MKTVIASTVTLVVGLALGWYFEHHRTEREKTETGELMVEAGESSDSERAARAARAIQFIESGQPQEAIRLLSGPIAHYYWVYGDLPTNERRSRLQSLIKELAKTNQEVAARIAEDATNYQIKAQ